jgi:hypothetical protein
LPSIPVALYSPKGVCMTEIKHGKLSDLLQDRNNANQGTEHGKELLEQSLRELGAGRSILIDKNGRIIAGNKTAQVATELGLDNILIIKTDGTKIIAVQRTDLDLSDPKARQLSVADNRISQLDLEWSEQVIQAYAAEHPGVIAGVFTNAELEALFSRSAFLTPEDVLSNFDSDEGDEGSAGGSGNGVAATFVFPQVQVSAMRAAITRIGKEGLKRRLLELMEGA